MSWPEKFHSIFARNCEIRHIDKSQANEFLDKYHIYGGCKAKHCYGVFVSRYSGAEMRMGSEASHPYPVGTLVAVASFSGARKWKKETDGRAVEIRSYEWLRYASIPEVRVIGAMGKILSSFIDEYAPDDIMSYAPLQYYSGEVYEKLGFVNEGTKTFNLVIDNCPVTAESVKYRLKLTEYNDNLISEK